MLKVKEEYLNGIYKRISELIGIENAKLIFKEYRGQQISFPIEFYSKQYIYDRIIEEYDGKNTKYLVQKYGYSERTVKRILKDKLKR